MHVQLWWINVVNIDIDIIINIILIPEHIHADFHYGGSARICSSKKNTLNLYELLSHSEY